MRLPLRIPLFLVVLALGSIHGAHAATLQVLETPGSSLNLPAGTQYVLSFKADVNGFASSQYVLQLELQRNIFVYHGADVKMGVTDQSPPNVDLGENVVVLSDDSLSPSSGQLIINVRLSTVVTGLHTVSWRLIVTGFQEPPSPPTLADVRGSVAVQTSAAGDLSINGRAVFDGSSDTVRIEVSAYCNVCGAVNSGNVTYILLDMDTGEPLGVSGPLIYSSETSLWIGIVDASGLELDRVLVLLSVVDSGGHTASITVSVLGDLPPTITLYTVGVPADKPVKVYVDDVLQDQKIHDTQPFRLRPGGGEHKVSVERLVSLGEGIRAGCRENQVYTSQVTGSHTFVYRVQYLVETDAKGGVITVDLETYDGYYDGGSIITLRASNPDPNLALFKWRINGDEASPDNPLVLQVTKPLFVEALWEDVSQPGPSNSSQGYTGPAVREAQITLSELVVMPTEASPKEAVTIELTFTNTGHTTGGREFFILIDGVPRFRTSQFLEVAETRTNVYRVSFDLEGRHSVGCMDKVVEVNVSQPASLITFQFVVVIGVAAILLILAFIIHNNL